MYVQQNKFLKMDQLQTNEESLRRKIKKKERNPCSNPKLNIQKIRELEIVEA